MKNMKISAKFILSFGIILFLTLAVVATVFITNTISNNALGDVQTINDFEMLASEFEDSFNDARIASAVMMYDMSVTEYENAVRAYDIARARLTEMRDTAQVTAILNYHVDPLNTLLGDLTVWRDNIESIETTNRRVEELQAYFLYLESSSIADSALMGEMQQQNLLNDIRDGRDQQDMLFRQRRIANAMDISAMLNAMLADLANAFGALDLSELPQIREAALELEPAIEYYLENSAQQHDIDAAEAVQSDINEIIAFLDEFAELVEMRDAAIATTRANAADVLTQVNAGLDSIAVLLLAGLESAENAGSISLILAIAMGTVALVVGVLIAVHVTGLITKPLKNIAVFMQQAATTGDLSLSEYQQKDIAERTQLKSEIGELYRNTAAFVMEITREMEMLTKVADGDLTIEPNVLSDKDMIGTALTKTVDNLNNMFSEVRAATAQVASGSRQVADGSQSLAQGSTEQAASVQQLSSSIIEIAEKTKNNASMAEKAAMLANDIKGSAEKGSQQMDEMMTAVKDINASSQNISKVIKSIDDIAFQTNILALNAAVEAARAGQHGKGFAVVAEEVRNLAAKSAEAAKDTESLIADSIEKAELGSRIADETAASLTEIVAGIGESSALVAEIAKSSEEQSVGIDQINRGIDQVAQVTQQNSATAEQSAAASQEMNSQSVMLEELIARFNLKDDSGFSNQSLPAASKPASTTETAPAAEPALSDDVGYGKY